MYTVLCQAVYGTIKFGLYYSAKEVLASRNAAKKESGLTNLGCAVFAGMVYAWLQYLCLTHLPTHS